MIMIEATPPVAAKAEWKIEYQFANQGSQAPQLAAVVDDDGQMLTFEIPLQQPNPPGLKARLRVEIRFWNDWNR